MNAFYETRIIFRDYTNYIRPLSYGEWKALPEDQKAAVLFVQFFDQITLAWEKLKSVYSDDHDGVSEVLQYLQKNVTKINDDEKRFSPAYIYRVAYNCLYCLCRDMNRHKRQYENEVSNIILGPDGELDLFDTILDNTLNWDPDMAAREKIRQDVWDTVCAGGRKYKVVCSFLLGENAYDKSEFKAIPEDQVEAILNDLRKKLAPLYSALKKLNNED